MSEGIWVEIIPGVYEGIPKEAESEYPECIVCADEPEPWSEAEIRDEEYYDKCSI